MKLYRADALVLRTVKVREADLLVVLFSREYGKIRAMAHGAQKATSRKRGFVQPFCHTRFLLRRGREMDSVSQCEGLESFSALQGSLRVWGYATYLADLVENTTADQEVNESIYWLLLQALRQLSSGDAEVLARAFEARLVALLGYRPVLQHCAACRGDLGGAEVGFSAASGGALCAACAGKERGVFWGHRGTLETLKLFLRWDLSRLGNLKVSAQARKELQFILAGFLEHHLGYRGRAPEFLKELEGNA
ncbi:MAG: DNA repair protein RecO [Desulfotomaculales bacterium]